MLETIDFSKKDLTREQYKPQHDELMSKLIMLQQRAHREGVGLVVLFEGWYGGTEPRISDLLYKLDARVTKVNVTRPHSKKELKCLSKGTPAEAPFMQEFWSGLGARGQFTFYDGGWYHKQIEAAEYVLFNRLRAHGKAFSKKDRKLAKQNFQKARALVNAGMSSIAEFEQQLVDDGYILVKFFVNLSQKGLKKSYEKAKKNNVPYTEMRNAERISENEYEVISNLVDVALEHGSKSGSWTIINGDNRRQANIDITKTLVDALETEFARREKAAKSTALAAAKPAAKPVAPSEIPSGPSISKFLIASDYPTIDSISHDPSLALVYEEYRESRKALQKRLHQLQYELYRQNRPLILAYEGWDAAGKGGNIKRVAQALDARSYTIFPSPAPTKIELAHPHLWRYWTRLPKAGAVGIYDRTWYGRVLVERIEGFTPVERWQQGYDEINAFEKDLVEWGAVLLKFWVDISPDEQLNRFKARAENPEKAWKLTDEDWRNREKYPEYKAAIDDMFRLTSTTFAPWHVLESENKYYARIKGLRIIVETLESELCGAS